MIDESNRYRCSTCGRFLSNVVAHFNGYEDITRVTGECSKHGKVEVQAWDYEDFVTWDRAGR